MGRRYTYVSLPWDVLPKDVPIVDATEPLVLDIRPLDTRYAQSRNPEACAVARALLRSLDGVIGVKIGAETALVHFGDRVVRYFISTETRKMVKAYDKADFFPSGVTAKLLPPPPSRQLGARIGEKKGGKHTGNGKPDIRSPKTPWLRHVGQASIPA